MHILIYEDDSAERLRPITLTRPTFTIACGGYRLVDHLLALGAPVAAILQPHLRHFDVVDDPRFCDLTTWQTTVSRGPPLALVVNARLVPSAAVRTELEELIDNQKAGIARWEGQLAAALIPVNLMPLPSEYTASSLLRVMADLELPTLPAELPLFQFAHDVIRHHQTSIESNLQLRLRCGRYQEVANRVFTASGADLGPHIATDTRGGPVVIEADVEVGPFSFLTGPLLIDHDARVRDHASIGAGTTIGHSCKVGGEILASIIEPCSNKQHHGFLGHSYIGSWVNVGAGTCTSNLKTTYGDINVNYGGQKTATGMQFLGAVIGDYAKTAINASIFTGTLVGVASFLYGTIGENVPSFVNYARSFGQISMASVDAVAAMQRRMFARRGRVPEPEDRELLEAVFELTRAEREDVCTTAGPPSFC